MGHGSVEFTLTLERVPSVASPASLEEVHRELWRWLDRFLAAERQHIDADYWEMYREGFASEAPGEICVFFNEVYGQGVASARVAQHWAYLALIARDDRLDRALAELGWTLVLPHELTPALERSSAGLVHVDSGWVLVEQLAAHQTLAQAARAKQLFVIDRNELESGIDPPALGELDDDERARVEWVAWTQLCQCRVCVALGTRAGSYLDPAIHVTHVRWAWELLETDPEIDALERAAYASGSDEDLRALAEGLAHREVRPPLGALCGMLRRRPEPRKPRKLTPSLPRVAKPIAPPPVVDVTGLEPLYQAVYREPSDDALRSVLADELQRRGDLRGELIALQLLPPTKELEKRIKRLLIDHGKAWLPGGARLANVRWERGFPAVARLDRLEREDLALATLRELDLSKLKSRALDMFAPCFAGAVAWLGVPLELAPSGPPASHAVRCFGFRFGYRDFEAPARLIERARALPFGALEELRVQLSSDQFSDEFVDPGLAWCEAFVAAVRTELPAIVRLDVWGALHYRRETSDLVLERIRIPYKLSKRWQDGTADSWLALARAFAGPIEVAKYDDVRLAPLLFRSPSSLVTYDAW